MREIMFLDIDGVLNIQSNSYSTYKARKNLCEPHLVERLNYICSKMENLQIVISSSWRRDMDMLKETLEEAGFKYWDKKVIGRTSISVESDSLKRGEQIFQWLEKNISETFIPQIDAMVYIIDDEARGIEEFWAGGFFSTDTTFFVDSAEGLDDKTCADIISCKRRMYA